MITEVLFVTVCHDLPGVSDGEEITYYLPGQEERLRHDLVQAFRHHSSLFANSYDYEDYFSCAEYSVYEDSFDEHELRIFRSVLSGAERQQPLRDLHPRDVYNGCCAVTEARLQSAVLQTVVSGVDLFNGLMDSGLPANDSRKPRCYIQVETVQEFASPFLRWLSEMAAIQHSLNGLSEKAEKVRTSFQTLRDTVVALEKFVQEHKSPLSDFVVGKFLLIMDCYQQATEGGHEPIYTSHRLSPYYLSLAADSPRERTGPQLSESDVIRAFAEAICKRMTRKSISVLQRMTSGGLSGDDSVLKSLWDEICAQVQYEESFYWEAYDETVRGIIRAEVKELQRHERDALWLQTPEGSDWLFDDEETREQSPVCEDDIVEYLVREHVYSAASNWSNRRIKDYLDHSYELD